ncbi:MAG: c-type cytochrome [Spirochaetia bacterium]|nr:c-type cytochrome [Spirochaetia bacterium]
MKIRKNYFYGGTVAVLFSAALLITVSCKEKEPPGKQVYMTKGCAACHNFGGGDSATGPDLKDVTQRRDADWLKKWLKDPPGMLASDPVAKEMAKKFPAGMPNMNLSDQEIDELIGYFKWESAGGKTPEEFKPLSDSEFESAKKIFFDRCSGCHGAKRWGATGPSLLPNSHIANAAELQGGGTRSKGTEALSAILENGTPGGMPAWGKEGILDDDEINLMARYVQMDPPEIPALNMEVAKKEWKVIIPVEDRPKTDETGGKYQNYFGVVLRDAGQVAIIDGDTKEKIAVLDSGYAVHILRSSHSGRYFYVVGRDGKLALIDLWSKEPKVVARARTCWDARSVDTSKGPGFHDKYAIIGCYTPFQYAIMDGETLEPLSITSVADAKDWATGNKLPEVRVASIVASDMKPFWVINLKEAGWVYLVDYTDPKKPKETRIKANNALHDGGWVQLPGSKEKRYFVVAANGKNQMCVIDTIAKKLVRPKEGKGPCIDVGKVPHPGRGANFVHKKYGPVFATTHIGDTKLTFIGVDPVGHPQYAWKVVENHEMKSAASLFVKTHPKSRNLWFDMPLSAVEGANGEVGVYNMDSGEIKYIKVSDQRIVHMEYNKAGDEVWISGWLDGSVYVYDDKTTKLKKRITGGWVKTPTGKFNVYNTMHDIY